LSEIPRAVVHYETAWLPPDLSGSIFAMVYKRLRGPAEASPARMIDIGVGVLIILIVMMLALTRPW
jgi:hypothetical protein